MQRNFPFIVLIQGKCCCYCKEKKPKKFPSENDMDPDEPEDLQGLNCTSFPVIIVYTLQVSWRKAWIPQKHNKLFPKCARILPQIYRHQKYLLYIANQQIAWQDLEILKYIVLKVARALCWLKENNRCYKNIINYNR